MFPLSQNDSFPYYLVLVFESERRLLILKVNGSTFLSKNAHRNEKLIDFIHLHTSSIRFRRFFHEFSLLHFCLGALQN